MLLKNKYFHHWKVDNKPGLFAMPRLVHGVWSENSPLSEARAFSFSFLDNRRVVSVVIAPVARGKRASERIRQHRETDPGDSKPLLICLLPGTSLIQHRVDEMNWTAVCTVCVYITGVKCSDICPTFHKDSDDVWFTLLIN